MSVIGYPESVLVSYASKGKAAAFSVAASSQLHLFNVRAFNNQGAAQNVGICRKHISGQYKLWVMSTGGTVFTDSTASISGGLQVFTTTNNDGFVVQDVRRFNVIGLTVSNTATGGTYTYKYWDGSAYQTLTTLEVPVYTAAADIWIAFQAPNDWAVGGTGVDADKYSIRVQATTAPGDTGSINAMWIGEFLEFYQAVPNNSAAQLSFPDSKPFSLNAGETLFPYFTTAAAGNAFGCYYSAR